MILTSKNFNIIFGNGDGLCMGNVMSNPNLEKGYYGELIVGEDFLIQVGNFALQLAEIEYEKGNIKLNNYESRTNGTN